MADCTYCGAPVGFGATRCNTETCYLQRIRALESELAESKAEAEANLNAYADARQELEHQLEHEIDNSECPCWRCMWESRGYSLASVNKTVEQLRSELAESNAKVRQFMACADALEDFAEERDPVRCLSAKGLEFTYECPIDGLCLACRVGERIEKAESELAELRKREEWIPVGERLPEQARRVLFWATHWDSSWPMAGIFDRQMAWFLGDDGCRYKLTGSAIYWRPLPASPHRDDGGDKPQEQ